MRLAINVLFMLKDRPPEYRGLVNERWSYGRKEALPFFELMRPVIWRALAFYTLFTDAEALNKEIRRLADWLSELTVEKMTE